MLALAAALLAPQAAPAVADWRLILVDRVPSPMRAYYLDLAAARRTGDIVVAELATELQMADVWGWQGYGTIYAFDCRARTTQVRSSSTVDSVARSVSGRSRGWTLTGRPRVARRSLLCGLPAGKQPAWSQSAA